MLRGIFMSPKATKEQVDYYVELFKKVRATPEWQDFMKNGAFNTTFLTGDDYAKWVEAEEKRHESLDEGSRLPRAATDRATSREPTQRGAQRSANAPSLRVPRRSFHERQIDPERMPARAQRRRGRRHRC